MRKSWGSGSWLILAFVSSHMLSGEALYAAPPQADAHGKPKAEVVGKRAVASKSAAGGEGEEEDQPFAEPSDVDGSGTELD